MYNYIFILLKINKFFKQNFKERIIMFHKSSIVKLSNFFLIIQKYLHSTSPLLCFAICRVPFPWWHCKKLFVNVIKSNIFYLKISSAKIEINKKCDLCHKTYKLHYGVKSIIYRDWIFCCKEFWNIFSKHNGYSYGDRRKLTWWKIEQTNF